MDEPMMGSAIAIVVCVISIILAIISITFSVKYKLCCKWSFRSHEIAAEIRFGRAKLFIDGRLEDEFSADRIRICMLRGMVDGEEVKVRVVYRAFKARAEATANGEPLTLLYAGK